MPDVATALLNIRLFSGIAPEGISQIAAITREESYPSGTVLFSEGETGDELYLILEGKVRVSRRDPTGSEETLAILGPGQAFGEMSLVDNFPRSADAHVHERCRVLVLSKDALEDLLFLRKDLAYEILWNFVKTLSVRLRETNDKLALLSISARF